VVGGPRERGRLGDPTETCAPKSRSTCVFFAKGEEDARGQRPQAQAPPHPHPAVLGAGPVPDEELRPPISEMSLATWVDPHRGQAGADAPATFWRRSNMAPHGPHRYS
jgi:hypothetical protein